MARKKSRTEVSKKIQVPPPHDWRTTDADEINKRRLRARTESCHITNTDPSYPIFSNFRIKSRSGLTYSVEIRDLEGRQFACDCVDFRSNGLGTCKHVEGVLALLERRHKNLYRKAFANGSTRIDVVPSFVDHTLKFERGGERLSPSLREQFQSNNDNIFQQFEKVKEFIDRASIKGLRISQEVAPWIERLRHAEERKVLRREYELKVHSGEWPIQETKCPLYPYQREGMLHLAFTERALLADEMGQRKNSDGLLRIGIHQHANSKWQNCLATGNWSRRLANPSSERFILWVRRLRLNKAFLHPSSLK